MRSLLARWRARPPEKPLRDELLSIERLEERAKALAALHTVDRGSQGDARNVFPRFAENGDVLRRAYLTLAEDVHRGEFVTAAGEWLLDNYHLVAAEIRDVRQNLPRGYYRELPKLAAREQRGHARVYAMAVELIRHSDSRLDRHQLLRFLTSYQTVAPLTIGELWAWPSMLKLALVENLRRLAEEEIAARAARRTADEYVARIDAAGQGRAQPLPPGIQPGVPGAAAAAGARVRAPPVGRPRGGGRPPRRAADGRGARDSRRAPAPGGGPGLCRERHHQPASLLDPRLEPVLRVREPRRERPPARPGGRLLPHGLPQPRPLSPGGRGPGRRHRDGPGPGCAARGGDRASSRRGRPRHARGARRIPPDRQGPRRPRGRRGVPPAPRAATAALRLPPCDGRVPRLDRRRHRRPARGRLRLREPAAPARPGRWRGWPSFSCFRRASSRPRPSRACAPVSRGRGGSPASTSRAACRRARGPWSSCPLS